MTVGSFDSFPDDTFTVRGNPVSLRSAAKRYTDFAGASLNVANTITRAQQVSWQGDESDDYRRQAGAFPPLLMNAHSGFQRTGTALSNFADTLETAQSQMSGVRAQALQTFSSGQAAQARVNQLASAPRPSDAGAASDFEHQAAAADNDLTGFTAAWNGHVSDANGIKAHVQAAAQIQGNQIQADLVCYAVPPPVGGGNGPGSPDGGTSDSDDPDGGGHWWDPVVGGVENAGRWTWNHVGVPVTNGAADVAQAAVQHPQDILGIVGGGAAIIGGAGGEVGGVALDVTGVGAVVGVPANVASAGLITTGVMAMSAGGGDLVKNASQENAQVAKPVESPSAPESWNDPETLDDHFDDHGSDVDASSPEDYANKANNFHNEGTKGQLEEHETKDGKIYYFDPKTELFGAFTKDGKTLTFFRPKKPARYWAKQQTR